MDSRYKAYHNHPLRRAWRFLVELFTVVCPHCGKRLSRGHSEVYDDPGYPPEHTCYKCGKNFTAGVY
jgi:hypothetical protein